MADPTNVRAAGIHRPIVPNIAPQAAAANAQLVYHQLSFAFVDQVGLNEANCWHNPDLRW